MGKHVDLIMNYSCNLNCNFCLGEPSNRNKNYSFSVLKSSIINLKKQGYDSISLNGGEPTIRADLINLIKFARYLGFKKIKLQTNGPMLSKEDYLKKILEAGVNSIGITIQSDRKIDYEHITRLDGSFDLVINALKNLKKNKVNVESDIVITKLNYLRLKDIFNFLISYSIKKFNFKFVSIGGNVKENMNIIPKIGEVCEELKKCLDVCKKDYSLSCTVQYLPHCSLKDYEEFILDLEKTDITIREGINSFEFKDIFKDNIKPKECNTCKFFYKCTGIEKEYLKLHSDFKPIPFERVESNLISPIHLKQSGMKMPTEYGENLNG